MADQPPFTVAIDGPASSGKSTLGLKLADALEVPFLDTGLLYRATGLKAADAGLLVPDDATTSDRPSLSVKDAQAVARIASCLVLYDLEHPALRNEETGAVASAVATEPAVRDALLAFQRRFAATPGGAVVAGRDIGSVVCPSAPCKFFVTASADVRAQRRTRQLRAIGETAEKAAVLVDLEHRDRRDAERRVAPLIVPDDAVVLDTSDMPFDAVLKAALAEVERRRAG